MCRSAVALSVARVKGTRLARVGVPARIMDCPEALPQSSRGSRRGGRRWDTTILLRCVWVVVVATVAVVTTVTVYLIQVLVVPSRLV